MKRILSIIIALILLTFVVGVDVGWTQSSLKKHTLLNAVTTYGDGEAFDLDDYADSHVCTVVLGGLLPTSITFQIKGSIDGTTFYDLIPGVGQVVSPSPNYISQGTFDASSNWTFGIGVTWNVGNYVDVSRNTTPGTLSESSTNMSTSPFIGEVMILQYDVSGWVDGGVTSSIGGATGATRTANGTYQDSFRMVNNVGIVFTPNSGSNHYVLDNIKLFRNENNGAFFANRGTHWIKGSYVTKIDGDATTSITLTCSDRGK